MICPSCLEQNNPDLIVCGKCGLLLSHGDPTIPPPPPGLLTFRDLEPAVPVSKAAPNRLMAVMAVALGISLGLVLNLVQGPENSYSRVATEAIQPLIPEPERLAIAPEPEEAGAFEFFRYDSSGSPTGFFSPCEAVIFRVNPENEPRGSRGMIIWALEELSKISGLELRLGSDTRESYNARLAQDGFEKEQVLIFFLTPEEFSVAAESPDSLYGDGPIGFAGPALVSLNLADRTYLAIGGDAVFNIKRVEELTANTTEPLGYSNPMALVYLHEFAHVLGLDHVAADDHLMFPTLDTEKIVGLAAGDRYALSVAGRGPCGIDESGQYFFG